MIVKNITMYVLVKCNNIQLNVLQKAIRSKYNVDLERKVWTEEGPLRGSRRRTPIKGFKSS